MADEMVLATQKWLNKTYGNIPEFNQPNEDGVTGWSTIYALIEGIQVELGVDHSALFPGFGDTTYSLYDQLITPNWNSLSENVVYLIQGAFWCKGISPGGFDGVQTQALSDAVSQLQKNAGFPTQDGILSAMWAQALFDMSAFVNLKDPRIREMQQYLNAHYYQYTGILPTDGIYQRATNTAIIYALQKEVGLDVETANGVFGPTTRQLYQEAYNNNWSDALSMIIQFGLYANMSEFWEVAGTTPPEFTGKLDSATQEGIEAFQQFMMLAPVTAGSPDLTTSWSLMTSNGNPNRNFLAVDTATQLTQQNIDDLVEFDVKYVGRYLTGTVGSDFTPKYLTREEAKAITDAGLSIIPLYEDILTTPDAKYYTFDKGRSDARNAVLAAAKLGIPNASVIYFAVDFDALDSDIDSNIIPYFEGVQEIVTGNTNDFHFQVGIYGTRNICTRVHDALGVQFAYVANMSSGWSGNLGFSQPLSWAFDQFYEGSYGSLSSLDFVAASELDQGVTELLDKPVVNPDNWILQFVRLLNWVPLNNLIESGEISLGAKVPIIKTWGLEVDVTIYDTVSGDGDFVVSGSIVNGKLQDKEINNYINKNVGSDVLSTNITSTTNKFIHGVEAGKVSVKLEKTSSGYEVDFMVDIEELDNFIGEGKFSFSVEINVTIKTKPDDSDDYKNWKEAVEKVLDIATIGVGAVAVTAAVIFIAPEMVAVEVLGEAAAIALVLSNATNIDEALQGKKDV